MYLPTDIANLALDAIGCDEVLGDIEDGTRVAQICLRAYRECLMRLLRSAHWNFARRQAPMPLLGDATGQTQNVGNLVIAPWIYEYALPNDCVLARFVPFSPILNNTAPPIMTGLAASPAYGQRMKPARFLISRDTNYPPEAGQVWWEVQGVSNMGRTVILTNVPNASLVYTSLVLAPSEWDPLFRSAMVAYLAQEIAVPVTKDRKLGPSLRAQQIAIVKHAIEQARISDGNESWSSIDHTPDWLSFRNSGCGWANGGGEMPGMISAPFAPLGMSDGSAY